MKVLVIDNYDSFTYNLVHILRQFGDLRVDVARNDEISTEEVLPYDKILLSPGPGIPDEAGVMKAVIERYADNKSILGVCLGMQGIAEVFQGKLFNLEKVYHGIASDIQLSKPKDGLFKNLPDNITVGRYHSWAVESETLPSELEITATDKKGVVMAIRHKHLDVKGVQFHPESIMTPYGKNILANWLYGDESKISLPHASNVDYNIHGIKRGYLFC